MMTSWTRVLFLLVSLFNHARTTFAFSWSPYHGTLFGRHKTNGFVLHYDQALDGFPTTEHLDTSVLIVPEVQDKIRDWLSDLPKLERSLPEWVVGNSAHQGSDILSISPSALLQEHLDSVMPQAPQLFPTEWSGAKFDYEWRYCLLKALPTRDLRQVLALGQSNTHPLRLAVVAIPAHTELQLHVHPAVELDIPIVGELYERRPVHTKNNNVTELLLPDEMLCRQPAHSVGTPLSNFAATPTLEELALIAQDLSSRVILPDHGERGRFVTARIAQGECLVNRVGSIHQSFTRDQPCLLWVLGPNVHAHFQPGNFHQRRGLEELTNIDHLIV